MKKKLFLVGAAAVLAVGLSSLSGCGSKGATITVAGKEYTEQRVLTHLVAELIENRTDIKVIRKDGLGGTPVVFAAIKKGEVDIYIEYSGTAYVDVLKHAPISDQTAVFNTVKAELESLQGGLKALDQFGFNNTYVITVNQDFATEHNLEKISDLKAIQHILHGGFTFEFMEREDGIIGLERTYDFKFNRTSGMEGALRYIALENKNINVTSAFGTDALIEKQGLVVLRDDLNFFPPYYAFPILRGDTYEKYPEIIPLMAELAAVLSSDAVMIGLNYRVDEQHLEPRVVAREFLLEKGLITG